MGSEAKPIEVKFEAVKEPRAIWVPPHWVRITDPELCELAMVVARTGVLTVFGRAIMGGSLTLIDVELGVVQRSLDAIIKGERFVVVWCPLELDRAPEVYHDPGRVEA